MRLDPLDEVAVGECRLDRAVDIDAVRPSEPGQSVAVAAYRPSPSPGPLSFEQRIGAAALLLLGRDFGAGAGDLACQTGNVFLQLGNPQKRQILGLFRLTLRQQVLLIHRVLLPSAPEAHYMAQQKRALARVTPESGHARSFDAKSDRRMAGREHLADL